MKRSNGLKARILEHKEPPSKGRLRIGIELGMLGVLIAILGCVLATYPQMEANVQAAPIYADVSRACVRVDVSSGWGGGAYGSGVVISKRRILTAAHVVDEADSVKVTLYVDGDYRKDLRARVDYVDQNVDLALLVVDEDLPCVAPIGLGKARNLKLHDKLMVIGAPGGEHPNFTTYGEFVSRESSDMDGTWLISAPIAHGMSGGGVFTLDGYLVGISVMADRSGTAGWMVPAAAVSDFLLRAAGQ